MHQFMVTSLKTESPIMQKVLLQVHGTTSGLKENIWQEVDYSNVWSVALLERSC